MSKTLQFNCNDINFISVSAQNALASRPLQVDFIIDVARPLGISDHAMDVVLMLHNLKPRSTAFAKQKFQIVEDYRNWVIQSLPKEVLNEQ